MFEVNHAIKGWAYSLDGTLTKLSLAVMISFCILATGHSIYLGVSGLSSSTWDTAAEIIALAMNSSPTHFLQNTCAGIIGIRTFQTNVRVMAVDSGKDGKEHLELVFGDVPSLKHSLLMENQEYGRLPSDEEQEI